VHALRDAGVPGDPRLGPSAYGKDFLPGVHARQLQDLARRRGTPVAAAAQVTLIARLGSRPRVGGVITKDLCADTIGILRQD
jgi:hypothetical protein